jgi:hypothetical protein
LEHNETNFSTKLGNFLGQEKLLEGNNGDKLWDKMRYFFGTGEFNIRI